MVTWCRLPVPDVEQERVKIMEFEILLKEVITFRECLNKKFSLKMDKMCKSTIKNNKFATTDYLTLKFNLLLPFASCLLS